MILEHQVQIWTHIQIIQIIFMWNQRYHKINQNRASMQTIKFSKTILWRLMSTATNKQHPKTNRKEKSKA